MPLQIINETNPKPKHYYNNLAKLFLDFVQSLESTQEFSIKTGDD